MNIMATYTSIYPESIFSAAFEPYKNAPHIGITEFRKGFKDGIYTDMSGGTFDVYFLGVCVTPEEWLQKTFECPSLLRAHLLWVDGAVPGLVNSDTLSKHDHYQTLISISQVEPEQLQPISNL